MLFSFTNVLYLTFNFLSSLTYIAIAIIIGALLLLFIVLQGRKKAWSEHIFRINLNSLHHHKQRQTERTQRRPIKFGSVKEV